MRLKMFVLLLLSLVIGLNAYPLQTSEAPISRNLIPVRKIPGTSLYTGIFYTMGMKKFPNGCVTWTNTDVKDKDGPYVQIDLNPENLPFYKLGQKWENDTQWIFEPSEQEGFYTLKNKGIPNGLVTSRKEDETNYNHVIIAKSPELVARLSTGGELMNDALIQPVQGADDGKLYQLKYKNRPDGTVTWTEKKYGDHSHYIQISESPDHKANYKKGGEWYDDTLFKFTPTSDVELEGSIHNFELTDTATTILDKYEQHTKRSEVEKFTIQNQTPLKDKQTIKQTIETENIISLTFTENLKALKNLEVAISFPTLTGTKIKIKIQADSSRLATNSLQDRKRQNVTVTSDIETQPMSTVEMSIVKDTLENVELPFRALMIVEGKADRMAADHSGFVKGPVPPEISMGSLEKAGFKIEGMRKVQDSLLVWVTGIMKCSFVVRTGINLL